MTLEDAVAKESDDSGLECPKCGCFDLEVVRITKQPTRRQKQWKCRHCSYAKIFTTDPVASDDAS